MIQSITGRSREKGDRAVNGPAWIRDGCTGSGVTGGTITTTRHFLDFDPRGCQFVNDRGVFVFEALVERGNFIFQGKG
ncbi:hypothetical protein GJ744_007543 [Endocarpon pusillum]|uniref:Uncharacterized protein n=1 Tax=Endocarpon pusillum TaxID=364733 RepID=A0A8H7AKK6_9EURO|nr:hypothetical protein GJ744_007543 [Endocarpon pusillum]